MLVILTSAQITVTAVLFGIHNELDLIKYNRMGTATFICTPGTQKTGGCEGGGASMDILEKTKLSCLYQESSDTNSFRVFPSHPLCVCAMIQLSPFQRPFNPLKTKRICFI
jgi:hypothetical protein